MNHANDVPAPASTVKLALDLMRAKADRERRPLELIGRHGERYPYSDEALWRILMSTERPTHEPRHAWIRRRNLALVEFVGSLKLLFGITPTEAIEGRDRKNNARGRVAKTVGLSPRQIWRLLP